MLGVAAACSSAPSTTGGPGGGGPAQAFPEMDTVPAACAAVAPGACSPMEYFLTDDTPCESLCSGEVFLLCEASMYSRFDCIDPGAAWTAAAGSRTPTTRDAG